MAMRKFSKYILRKKFKRNRKNLLLPHEDPWSNETIITIDDGDVTHYSLGNFYSKCTVSITIEAVNSIGSSLPSEPLHFQTNIQRK